MNAKYLKYAIGEIILVVMGILLALGINNWNTERLKENQRIQYYQSIAYEFQGILTEFQNRYEPANNELIEQLEQSLFLIKEQPPSFLDSLASKIGALGTSWTYDLSTPVYDEFKQSGLLNELKENSLKKAFSTIDYLLARTQGLNEILSNQYLNTIEPYIIKNINYSGIALPMYRETLIQGGPKTDFKTLINSMDLWNILTIKLEAQQSRKRLNETMIRQLEELINILESQ